MAAAPTFKVYDNANNYQAAAKTLDLAKAAAAHLGPGATVRNGHRTRHIIHTTPEGPNLLSQLHTWQADFIAHILPIRGDDTDQDDLRQYDEAYTEHLEDLHDIIRPEVTDQ